MAMGKRDSRERQQAIWVEVASVMRPSGHPFYEQLNELLWNKGFDKFAEQSCQRFYAAKIGRPGLAPGIYFRALVIGYFEGIDSERGIAWRAADSLALRNFLGFGIDQTTPDHSTIFTHAPFDRCGNASGGIRLGAADTCRRGASERQHSCD
jgi:transposase